jgi:hypothetical protein
MREATYKDQTIRALSYKLSDGAWIARVEVRATTPGATQCHSVNGTKQYPTEDAADKAAILMGETWTDSHNQPRVRQPKSLSGFGALHGHTKTTKKKAAAPKADGANGNGNGKAGSEEKPTAN